MSNHQVGGKKAARTTKRRYGKDFFKRMGKLGGNPTLLRGEKHGN
jgi:hypothetical protein